MKYLITLFLLGIMISGMSQTGTISMTTKDWNALQKKQRAKYRSNYGYYPHEGFKIVKGVMYVAVAWRNGYAIKWEKMWVHN